MRLMIMLETEIKKSDLVAFYKFAYWQSPSKRAYRRKNRIQHGLGFAMFPSVLLFIVGAPFSTPLIWNLSFITLVLFFLGYKLAEKLALGNAEKGVGELLNGGKNQELLGWMSIELREEEIILRTRNSETKFHKKLVGKLEQNQYYYFIFTTLISGYVVPKRAFKSSEEQVFFEKWWEDSPSSE